MSVPKQRHTSSRRDRRRSHHSSPKITLSRCSHCGDPALPHTVCANCGYYRGHQVIDVLAKLDKKEKKNKQKELSAKEKKIETNKPLDMEALSKK